MVAVALALTGGALLAGGARADAPASVVVNGGLEDWQDAPAALQQAVSCPQLPGGWNLNPGLVGKQFSLARDAEVKHGGESSARLANPDTTSAVSLLQRLSVEPEMRYVVRMWLRGEKVDAYHPKGVIVTLVSSSQNDPRDNNMWAGSLAVADKAPSPNQGTFDWRELVGIVDTPPGTKSLMLVVTLRGAGTMWVDDVQVTPLEKCIEVESY
jgi:hypothetical protein